MSEINRSLIVLKPKQPFLDWAHSLDEERNKFTLQELAHDSIAYLIPELWEDADQEAFLESSCEILFEDQLAGWWTDEAAWPKQRNLAMFLEWFEVEFHSLVFDLCDDPIRVIEDDEHD
jgi:hypothetical protein